MLGERALDFVELADRASSINELSDLFGDAIAEFGLGTFACGRLPAAGEPEPKFYALYWPSSFAEPYMESRLHERDPVLRAVIRGEPAASWSELQARNPADYEAWRLLSLVRDSGWREGFFVPVCDRGRPGCVGMAGSCRALPGGARQRAALKIMAHAMYQRARELGSDVAGEQQVTLTPRQREVMHWVAAGLSDSAVADRLGISEATAHFHVESAKRRLGASTRTQAVAMAVHRRLIRP